MNNTESVSREREARTILCFLREQMDVVDGERGRKRTLKERLGLKGMGCCGATWGFRPAALSVRHHDDDDDGDEEEERQRQQPQQEEEERSLDPTVNDPVPICSYPDPPAPSMNLAAALAAERQLRASNDNERRQTEAKRQEVEQGKYGAGDAYEGVVDEIAGGNGRSRCCDEDGEWEWRRRRSGGDSVCCVCMGRKKGAAFIPCGHTFCRVCSRELWLNRGSCPLCNRPILEILDIF